MTRLELVGFPLYRPDDGMHCSSMNCHRLPPQTVWKIGEKCFELFAKYVRRGRASLTLYLSAYKQPLRIIFSSGIRAMAL